MSTSNLSVHHSWRLRPSMAISILVCSFAFACSVCAQEPSSAQPADPLSEARALFVAGRYDDVIRKLTPVTPKPSSIQFNYLLGISYYQKRDYEKAVPLLTPVVQIAPESTREFRESAQALALSHYLLGHIKEALPLLEKVIQWSPENTELRYVLAISYLQSHQLEQARDAFAKMFKLQPESAAAHLMTGQMMVRQQFEEFAERELRRALEIDASDSAGALSSWRAGNPSCPARRRNCRDAQGD